MFVLAKLLAIAVVAWFFSSAKEHGESPINWAIIGLIGYAIIWVGVKFTLVDALWGAVKTAPTAGVLLAQVPALCGVAGTFFIRKKLIANAEAEKE